MILGAIIGSVLGLILSLAADGRTQHQRDQDALAWAVIGAIAGLLIAAAL